MPPLDPRLLLDTAFDSGLPLVPPAPPSRAKGWRAFPLGTGKTAGLAVRKEAAGLFLGYGLHGEKAEAVIEAGARALLAQEVRNPRGGHYTFTVKVTGVGSSLEDQQEELEQVLRQLAYLPEHYQYVAQQRIFGSEMMTITSALNRSWPRRSRHWIANPSSSCGHASIAAKKTRNPSSPAGAAGAKE